MFVPEAKWIGDQIACLQLPLGTKCLNLGSSTRFYRECSQPHVNRFIFEPLRGLADTTHVDIKAADGVDISGNFMDEAFWPMIPEGAFNLVMCCNLLTHVPDQAKAFELMRRSVAPNGYIVISTPHVYPYCADPLDVKYRPDQDEIRSSFPLYHFVAGTSITLPETHFSRLKRSPKAIVSLAANIVLPRKGLLRWKAVVSDMPNMFKQLSTVCVIMQAPGISTSN